MKRSGGRAGRFVTSWESVPVPGPRDQAAIKQSKQLGFSETFTLVVCANHRPRKIRAHVSNLTLLIPLDLNGCSIYSRNRPCLSLLSGGHHNIITCFKSLKSERYLVLPGTAFSIKIITEIPVGRDLWRSLVQPPTQSRTFTNTRAGQLWPHTGKPRKLPTTEIHHIW